MDLKISDQINQLSTPEIRSLLWDIEIGPVIGDREHVIDILYNKLLEIKKSRENLYETFNQRYMYPMEKRDIPLTEEDTLYDLIAYAMQPENKGYASYQNFIRDLHSERPDLEIGFVDSTYFRYYGTHEYRIDEKTDNITSTIDYAADVTGYNALYDKIKSLVSDEEFQVIIDYVNKLANGNPLLQMPLLKDSRCSYLHYDGDSKMIRMKYKVNKFELSTIPYGMKGIWPYHYVTAYDGIPISTYYTFWHHLRNPISSNITYQKIQYLLSKNSDLAKRVELGSNSDNTTNICNIIINLPSIAKYLVGECDDLWVKFVKYLANVSIPSHK